MRRRSTGLVIRRAPQVGTWPCTWGSTAPCCLPESKARSSSELTGRSTALFCRLGGRAIVYAPLSLQTSKAKPRRRGRIGRHFLFSGGAGHNAPSFGCICPCLGGGLPRILAPTGGHGPAPLGRLALASVPRAPVAGAAPPENAWQRIWAGDVRQILARSGRSRAKGAQATPETPSMRLTTLPSPNTGSGCTRLGRGSRPVRFDVVLFMSAAADGRLAALLPASPRRLRFDRRHLRT